MAFLIDVTGSMGTLLGKLKLILPTVFQHTYATLEEKKVSKVGFEIQLVLYRNYADESKDIL